MISQTGTIGFAFLALLAVTITRVGIRAQSPSPAYANFEAAQTNPIRLSSDRTRLFAVNTANNSLSVFDVTTPSRPNLLAEIPVGIGPVSVNPLNDDEAWVVNQVSNSVSVVSGHCDRHHKYQAGTDGRSIRGD